MGTSDDNSKDMGFIHVQQWQTLHRKQQERRISGGPFFLGGGGGGETAAGSTSAFVGYC